MEALTGGGPIPGVVPLAQGQKSAVGALRSAAGPEFGLCTATFIADGVLLSAAHCAQYAPLEFELDQYQDGLEPSVLDVVALRSHPTRDVLLAWVEPVDRLNEVTPIQVLESALETRWTGAVLQLAGTGLREDGAVGTLEFLAEEVIHDDETSIVVDGMGRTGGCDGDSGGPLLAGGGDGAARVLGVLARGTRSCRGVDVYERIDTLHSWFEANEVEMRAPPAVAGCGDIDPVGTCQGDLNVYCDGDVPRVESCTRTGACGWNSLVQGYRCVSADDDACAGVGRLGACRGFVLQQCAVGKLVETDCQSCALECRRDSRTGTAMCI